MTAETFVVPGDVLVAQLQGEAVILHLESKRYYRLNDSAACIWRAIERHEPMTGIVDELIRSFDVAQPEAYQQAERVVGDLLERGLIARSPAALS